MTSFSSAIPTIHFTYLRSSSFFIFLIFMYMYACMFFLFDVLFLSLDWFFVFMLLFRTFLVLVLFYFILFIFNRFLPSDFSVDSLNVVVLSIAIFFTSHPSGSLNFYFEIGGYICYGKSPIFFTTLLSHF